ncbi:4-alpha-glucanotransferase [Butyrivibrio hungatei]|uniref:4-alpha-glucanotransferase n=1 Tax=Butyrivibrio hungatei TaxID=185008 RepID=A0A1G5FTV7_9FIRM|nr:4-alpha-glucanotransferase [Butyrivibrio hungatei]SCY42564.1 4-alpha-glucanotransferase [Butyrivibrio hungatei]
MKKSDNMQKRACGVLLPVFSLPSEYGIGAFSKEAYSFVDFLKKAGQKYWQILPLGPTGYGDSPYQSFSTFAGNPYLIDPEYFVEKGLLTRDDLEVLKSDAPSDKVDYKTVEAHKYELIRKAFGNVEKACGTRGNAVNIGKMTDSYDLKADFEKFKKNNGKKWLFDYALFMALKDMYGGRSWNTWDEDIRLRKKGAMEKYREKLAEEIDFYCFVQFVFYVQWNALKKYANDSGIEIIGDIPIYVAFDSSDTWANPELFLLDKDNVPIEVAGCPPDAFSKTGQLWGNPLYKWDYHKQTGYKWWLERIGHCYKLYDVLRIDHFRGFDEYYAIPYGNPTAEIGKWRKGPGYDLFDAIKKEFGDVKVIAEDLGFLTPSVIKLVKKTGYPGMKVLHFAFGADDDSEYLPHYYSSNCVVYTGTHDNDTTKGWYKSLNRNDKKFVRDYLGISSGSKVVGALIRAAFSSVAYTAIIPMQDYLELDESARINIPSTLGGNWKWKMEGGELTDELCERMYEYARVYGRLTAEN